MADEPGEVTLARTAEDATRMTTWRKVQGDVKDAITVVLSGSRPSTTEDTLV